MDGRTHDGTSFHNSYVWVYEFHGDLIYRMTEHADTLLAHRAFPRRASEAIGHGETIVMMRIFI